MISDRTPKTVAIIQARMGSSRLPGKVLLDIAGKPMLSRVTERASRAKKVSQMVIATTAQPEDDAVAAWCAESGFNCYRGSLHDVLDRYYQAARLFNAEVIVRITADCPLIDPLLVDRTVEAFFGKVEKQDQQLIKSVQQTTAEGQKHAWDFVANRLPPPWGRTYPIGLDTEVCSFEALEIAWKEAKEPHHREHVLPFLYENSDRFRILLVNHTKNYGMLRWTVDTSEDLELVRRIFAYFGSRDIFSWLEIVDLFQTHPELALINAQVRHKSYAEIDERMDKYT